MLENFEKIMQGTYTQIMNTEKSPKKGKVEYVIVASAVQVAKHYTN